MKRSSDRHWAIIDGPLTRNEEKFLAEQKINRIEIQLGDLVATLAAITAPTTEAA